MFAIQHKLNPPLLTRLQRNALKTLQLLDRPRHRGHRIANVKLDHLITRSLARFSTSTLTVNFPFAVMRGALSCKFEILNFV